jgi:hypothetical protein
MKVRTPTQYFLEIELIALEEHLDNALDRTVQLRAGAMEESDAKRLELVRQVIGFTKIQLEGLRLRPRDHVQGDAAELLARWDLESPS